MFLSKYYIFFHTICCGILSITQTVLSTASTRTFLKEKQGGICQKLEINKLFSLKKKADKKLQSTISLIEKDKKLPERTRNHRLKVLNVLLREFNDTESQFRESISNLKTFLRGDYESILQLKQSSKLRLDQLRNAMVQAEDEYNLVIEEERKEELSNKLSRPFKTGTETVIRDFINNLFVDISKAADMLQSKLDDDSFEHEIHGAKQGKIDIETVVKVGGKTSKGITCI